MVNTIKKRRTRWICVPQRHCVQLLWSRSISLGCSSSFKSPHFFKSEIRRRLGTQRHRPVSGCVTTTNVQEVVARCTQAVQCQMRLLRTGPLRLRALSLVQWACLVSCAMWGYVACVDDVISPVIHPGEQHCRG
jgi:hypothetical protein